MKYWLNLFTWTTWQEFLEAGGTVSGFRENRWRTVQRMRPGDIFICYLTGLSRFFAILEITGKPHRDDTPIWKEAEFSARVPVRVVLSLPPEHAVPVHALSSQLSYFRNMKGPHSWTGHFRRSPVEEKPDDARAIIAALEEAERNPVFREYDERKLERKVPLFETKSGTVTIPEDTEDSVIPSTQIPIKTEVTHEEIQWLLLDLGSQIGLDVWVARNDRNKSFRGQAFQSVSRLRSSLPRQFDDATNKTIELIDVLWLRENAIVAAFEVEHTTSIYSGLLRMSDLASMQPNLNIRLYIVAPDEKRDQVFSQINRPTFSRMKPPLRDICQFIPYSQLKNRVEQARDLIRYLKPEFLDEIAETFEADFE